MAGHTFLHHLPIIACARPSTLKRQIPGPFDEAQGIAYSFWRRLRHIVGEAFPGLNLYPLEVLQLK